jgi:hypothetical protein
MGSPNRSHRGPELGVTNDEIDVSRPRGFFTILEARPLCSKGPTMTRHFKNPIPKDQTAAHTALAGLAKEFRDGADWFGKPANPPIAEGTVLAMIRMPNPEPDPGKNRRLVAMDRGSYKGRPEEISDESLAEFWSSRLRHTRACPPDWYKAGGVIWDHLGFVVENEWTAMMLGLDHADEAMTRACQAALFNAFATAADGVDLESVLLALATFVHAHPRFSDVAPNIAWYLPYGGNTAYQALPYRIPKATRTRAKMKHRP